MATKTWSNAVSTANQQIYLIKIEIAPPAIIPFQNGFWPANNISYVWSPLLARVKNADLTSTTFIVATNATRDQFRFFLQGAGINLVSVMLVGVNPAYNSSASQYDVARLKDMFPPQYGWVPISPSTT